MRIKPLGFDKSKSIYWYFYGTRLYREDIVRKGQKNNIWQVICFTKEDWNSLATKFKKSTNRKERALYKILVTNILPNIPSLFRAREKERRLRYELLKNILYRNLKY